MTSGAFNQIIELEDSYTPSEGSVATLRESGLIVYTGEIASAGKDTNKDKTSGLLGGFTPPSSTTRGPRDSDKGDYIYHSDKEFLEKLLEGTILEFAVLRKRYVYATDSVYLKEGVAQGKRPVKDLELRGLMKLRAIDDRIRAIYPLPDLRYWLDLLHARENLPGKNLRDFLSREPLVWDTMAALDGDDLSSAKAQRDIVDRLEAAAEQRRLVEEFGLCHDPNTLFIINTFGDLAHTAAVSAAFAKDGRKLMHTGSEQCLFGFEVLDYLDKVTDLADEMLEIAV